jgi:ribosomal subunit interface protein
MKIVLKKSIELTPVIEESIGKKMAPLAKLIKHLEAEGEREIRLEIERDTKHKKGDVFRMTANLSLPGKILYADERADDLRTAIDRVRDVMRSEIEKYRTERE